MANKKHVAMLRRSVEEGNKWRNAHLRVRLASRGPTLGRPTLRVWLVGVLCLSRRETNCHVVEWRGRRTRSAWPASAPVLTAISRRPCGYGAGLVRRGSSTSVINISRVPDSESPLTCPR